MHPITPRNRRPESETEITGWNRAALIAILKSAAKPTHSKRPLEQKMD